jgi:PhnB protein
MKTATLEESWRQVKRWAWRHLNSAHPGGRTERGDPAWRTSAMAARGKVPIKVSQASDTGEQRVSFRIPFSRVPAVVHSITPNIIVHDADKAIDFLKRAFGIRENYRVTTRGGKVAHCELQLENSIVILGESVAGCPAHGLVAKIHAEDSDALFEQAIMAGATAVVPMKDMLFGSREGCVADPFGNVWIIATRTEGLSPQEMQRRMTAHNAPDALSNQPIL